MQVGSTLQCGNRPLDDRLRYDKRLLAARAIMAEFKRPRIGCLGAGQMASALARGWTAAKLVNPEDGLASDPSPEARSLFSERSGWKAVPSNRDIVVDSEVVVLAIKPQAMSSVIADVRALIKTHHVIISIAAGVTLQRLTDENGEGRRMILVMPSAPSR